MSTYRGIKGQAALGGVVTGAPLVQGAVAHGASAATFDGAAFNGVVKAGDQFTVAGDSQEYTVVTGGVVGATTAHQVAVTFTPTVQVAGGWADNAAVTLASNSIAQVTAWAATPSRPYIETTTMGAVAKTGTLDVPTWTGSVSVQMDYGDPKQQAYIDAVRGSGDITALALVLVTADGKQFAGDVLPTQAKVAGQRGALFTLDCDFQGEGALVPNWN